MKLTDEQKKQIQELVSKAYYEGSDAGEEAGETNEEYDIGNEIISLVESFDILFPPGAEV